MDIAILWSNAYIIRFFKLYNTVESNECSYEFGVSTETKKKSSNSDPLVPILSRLPHS